MVPQLEWVQCMAWADTPHTMKAWTYQQLDLRTKTGEDCHGLRLVVQELTVKDISEHHREEADP
jgi:hypothetical protein